MEPAIQNMYFLRKGLRKPMGTPDDFLRIPFNISNFYSACEASILKLFPRLSPVRSPGQHVLSNLQKEAGLYLGQSTHPSGN